MLALMFSPGGGGGPRAKTMKRPSGDQLGVACRLAAGRGRSAHVTGHISSAVASWAEFEALAPEFAARVRGLLLSRKHLTIATLRAGGAPRISGSEVEIADGQLRIGSMPGARKAQDLRRDPRIAIHGPTVDPPAGDPAAWIGETKLSGTAIEVESGSSAHRFLIDIDEAVITHLNEAGNRLVVHSWHLKRGYRP